jgi:hypothetical protein
MLSECEAALHAMHVMEWMQPYQESVPWLPDQGSPRRHCWIEVVYLIAGVNPGQGIRARQIHAYDVRIDR